MMWSFIIIITASLALLLPAGIVSAISSGVVSNAIWGMFSFAVPATAKRHITGINGFWLGKVSYRESGRYNYNLYKIKERHGEVSIYIEHLHSDHDRVLLCHGRGSFRPPTLAAYYDFDDKNMSKNGTVILRLGTRDGHDPVLSGYFTQFVGDNDSLRKKLHRDVRSERYILVKVNIPISRRMRRAFRLNYFKSIDDITGFIETMPDRKKRLLQENTRGASLSSKAVGNHTGVATPAATSSTPRVHKSPSQSDTNTFASLK